MKTKIEIRNASVKIPIYDANHQSLRTRILSKRNNFEKDRFIVTALNNVNLKLFEGDKVGILGDNGSGKTSLLKLCSGAYIPDIGECITKGKITSLIDVNMGFDDDATGYENVILKGLLLNKTPNELKKFFRRLKKFQD